MNVSKKQLGRIPPHENHKRTKYGRNEEVNQACTDEILGKRTHNILLNSFTNRPEWIITHHTKISKNSEYIKNMNCQTKTSIIV